MSLEELIRQFLSDPKVPEGQKAGIQALWQSHLTTGRALQEEGRWHEAIEAYAQEHDRIIRSDDDAYIVQSSYWFVGRAYRALGDLAKAEVALQKSRELHKRYGVGARPHEDLAEMYISQRRFDEAIALCQEALQDTPSWPIKQLLAKALTLKAQSPK